ncbi:IS630 family transposase [Desulfolutivibrio sulfoxidireducens]|uniref:IS630 family transposase n=1 Tax=Desulfolutivibrio sulfoxidireducens TaxID=2773299 RepID=UPI00159CF40B|nr:IS630 family transposase [Desulfolutivibrio sulfoxidireducens]
MLQKRPEAEVFFFDEGRFGFKPVTGRRWARKGVRPMAVVRPGYQNFSVYSAISPFTGEDVSLFLPWVNTLTMHLFLAHLSLSLGERCCFLVMDQAGWHVSDDLIIPANIELVFRPPYSPELNPVERLWQWLKRHSLRNRCHESLEAIMDAVQDCLQVQPRRFFRACAGVAIYCT